MSCFIAPSKKQRTYTNICAEKGCRKEFETKAPREQRCSDECKRQQSNRIRRMKYAKSKPPSVTEMRRKAVANINGGDTLSRNSYWLTRPLR